VASENEGVSEKMVAPNGTISMTEVRLTRHLLPAGDITMGFDTDIAGNDRGNRGRCPC